MNNKKTGSNENMQRELSESKVKALKLSRQAQGTLAKVILMIESGEYCPDIIQQIDSVTGLLNTSRKQLLAGHLESCLIERLKTDKEGSIEELLKIYNMK